MRKDNQKGFTLVEMMVVIAIISIVMVSFVRPAEVLRRYTLRSFTQELSDFIMTTQQLATLKNEEYTIGVVGSKADNYIEANTYKREFVLPIPAGIEVSVSTGEGTITFSKDMSPTKAGTFFIKDNYLQQEMRLTVQVATGNVTLYEE